MKSGEVVEQKTRTPEEDLKQGAELSAIATSTDAQLASAIASSRIRP